MPKNKDDMFDRILAAKKQLAGQAHITPVMTSRTLDRRVGAAVYLKCENYQRVGAFKFRGAYNAMARLSEEDVRRGVITHSSGNHAQAVAVVGRLLGIQTTIVMPNDAPATKRAAPRESSSGPCRSEGSQSRAAVGRQASFEASAADPSRDHS